MNERFALDGGYVGMRICVNYQYLLVVVFTSKTIRCFSPALQ